MHDSSSPSQLTKDEFFRTPWQESMQSFSPKLCSEYWQVFKPFVIQAKETNDSTQLAVFDLLNAICRLLTNYEFDHEPYQPILHGFPDGERMSRSFLPDDLGDPPLDLLQAVYPEISDLELRARIADIVWIRRKDFRAVKVAILS